MEKKKNKSTIIVNFKKLVGAAALELVDELSKSDDLLLSKYDIILALQAPDAVNVPPDCKFRIFIQDTFSDEKDGFLSFFQHHAIRHPSVAGVILNHPEKKLSAGELHACVEKARALDMEMLICATTISEAVELNRYAPHYIGIESEALIGKDDSFTNHCPDIVEEARQHIQTDILIGAGIKTPEDLHHVINTGGSGVLVSSLILKSKQPLNTLTDFLN
ncbi:triose-phosphate isomerase [Chitinophaga sp. Cy-1792]|uniref:triose-phosphate isomerase n=1 Tax=Chitinophaga sp. Cy-1792 TaxID=2608339 RepID=UPI00142330B6|nr:triose-phosphate isomerase [Chitinophaga sp. Cy-1792]NIG57749.1 hypothetical protein [Chitinophaga sp. Cy-1792]